MKIYFAPAPTANYTKKKVWNCNICFDIVLEIGKMKRKAKQVQI